MPAFTAAVYSFVSILITLFIFRETHPPERRGQRVQIAIGPLLIMRYLWRPALGILLLLMFAQQLIFFGYESMLACSR